jgi:hypothetical protein
MADPEIIGLKLSDFLAGKRTEFGLVYMIFLKRFRPLSGKQKYPWLWSSQK